MYKHFNNFIATAVATMQIIHMLLMVQEMKDLVYQMHVIRVVRKK